VTFSQGGRDSLVDSGLVGSTDFHSGRDAMRAEDAQGTPTQSHIPPRILIYENKACARTMREMGTESEGVPIKLWGRGGDFG